LKNGGFPHFAILALFANPLWSCISKCKYFILMTFWGATSVVQTRTNDRGVEHGCEEKGQEGQEGDQEEGRQEEEVIDLGQLVLLGYP
jgi:hypothetical protein